MRPDRYLLTITEDRFGHAPKVLTQFRVCALNETTDLRPALIRTARELIAACQCGLDRDHARAEANHQPEAADA
jgi:hypothetical protein